MYYLFLASTESPGRFRSGWSCLERFGFRSRGLCGCLELLRSSGNGTMDLGYHAKQQRGRQLCLQSSFWSDDLHDSRCGWEDGKRRHVQVVQIWWLSNFLVEGQGDVRYFEIWCACYPVTGPISLCSSGFLHSLELDTFFVDVPDVALPVDHYWGVSDAPGVASPGQQRKQRPRARRWHSHETAMDGGPQVSGCWERKSCRSLAFQSKNWTLLLSCMLLI